MRKFVSLDKEAGCLVPDCFQSTDRKRLRGHKGMRGEAHFVSKI